jgi:hypothetical protein
MMLSDERLIMRRLLIVPTRVTLTLANT